jgi:hypothetical protein
MALSANTPIQEFTGRTEGSPVYTAVHCYEGCMLGDVSGYVRPLVAGDLFRGHALIERNNTSGSSGDYNIEHLTGQYRLQVTLASVSIKDVGKDVYATDDATLTFTQAGNSWVGKVVRYVAANTAVVAFDTFQAPLCLPADIILGSLLTGAAHHSIYVPSDTQCYAIGTERRKGGRTLYYARAGTAGVIPNMGAKFTPATILSEAVHLDAAVGATTFVMEEAGITANQWAGGYVICHTAAGTQQNRQILSNTASAASTNHVTVTIDGALTTALVGASTLVEIMASPWWSLEYTTNERASHAGVPMCVATVGQFFWCLAEGQAWVSPGGGTTPGDSNQDRIVYWVGDGSVNGGAHLTYQGSAYQKAGFIIDATAAGGPPFVWFGRG